MQINGKTMRVMMFFKVFGRKSRKYFELHDDLQRQSIYQRII